MNIEILAVGKIKETYLRDAIAEYKKRLSKYCRLVIREVQDEKTVDQQSEALNLKVKQTEGERLLKLIRNDAFVVTLEINGKMLASEEQASLIAQTGIRSVSTIQFIIGGSLGLSEEVTGRADFALSFSKMTFPHQLMRLILIEQIYRSYRIIKQEPYHK